MGTLRFNDVCFLYEKSLAVQQKRRKAARGIAEEELVLKHLNLTIENGEFLCLVGHSGCGKSTTLRMLAGLHEPTSGDILINDKPLRGPGLDRSVVFQNYSLFPWMKVGENVEFGIRQASVELGRGLSKEEVAAIASDYLGKVNMQESVDLYPYQLSGGMQQRVAIARALAMDTEALLFDEPFGALDVKTRRELQELMESLWMSSNVRKTAVFVTHDIEEALLLADRVVFMSGGRFLDEFAVKEPRLRNPEVYLKSEAYEAMRKRLVSLFYNAEETRLDQTARERVYDGVGAL